MYLIICIVALLASGLTLFSGLTLLTEMPMITSYMIGLREFHVTVVMVVIGLLMMVLEKESLGL